MVNMANESGRMEMMCAKNEKYFIKRTSNTSKTGLNE
jgi:hypothetical protein